jgi:2-keto-4-pentenoate hydratase/2-oxohepta-3-ene-1,7-dioic acid hydratase in catechol pathway
MKIVRYTLDKKTEYGIWDGELVQSLTATPYRQLKRRNRHHRLSDLKLLPPCTPSKIVALGLNYHSHAREIKMPVPAEPLIFLKPSTSVIGPEDNIVYPESSERIDYEGELGVVIKNRTRRVSTREAMNHVLGYTCFNDVTARDLQRRDMQWTRAKSFDTFSAIGPCIETELDPGNVYLETCLNGELKQQGNTSDLVFSVPELVSFISHIMTLLPGDIIATGTPSGIGPMKPGDTVEVKIEPIGTLRNYVV